MNQRERFEAAWRAKYPNDSEVALSWNRGRYVFEPVQDAWEWLQKGEASGLELAAKVCEAKAAEFKSSALAAAVDRYSSKLANSMAENIRSLLAREGA